MNTTMLKSTPQTAVSELAKTALIATLYVVVTAGVVLANFMSPTWILDVPIGGIATLLVLLLCRRVTRNIKNDVVKMGVTAIIFALSMFTVAGQFAILYGFPFWFTYFTVGVGGMIVHALHKKNRFYKIVLSHDEIHVINKY